MRLQRIPPVDDAERHVLALLRGDFAAAAPGGSERVAAPAAAARADASLSPFWMRVLELVAAHRVGELLYARRGQGDWWPSWPPAAREFVRRLYVETGVRNDFFRRELVRVVDALAGAGITPVLLKGAALALTTTPDPAERPYGDIDLLIGRAEVDAAHAAMLALGYALDDRFESEAFYRRHHFHLIYRNPRLPWCCFELHWDVVTATMDTRFDAAAMVASARPAELDGRRVLVPAPDDFLLHLALHAAVNGFNYLGQIRDVHMLLERHAKELPAGPLWEKATRFRVATPLWAVLALAPLFGPSPAAAALLAGRLARPQGPLARLSPGWALGSRPPLIRALLRPESLLRQRTRHSLAGSVAIALLRRDRLCERLAFIRRRFRPTPDLLAEQTQHDGFERAVSVGAGLPQPLLRTGHAMAYILLMLAGWEVVPGPARAAKRRYLSS